jgi:uncharacterized membrane-anchored protein
VRKLVVIGAGIAILALVNVVVMQRERLLASGAAVLLELAPVDPRSLLQGDYMALEFRAARQASGGVTVDSPGNGHLVLAVDARGVGNYVRRDDGTPLAAGEVRLRYRVRDGRVKLVTNAWFFEEGQGEAFEKARYGEFRVDADGEALLAGLRDAELRPIGASR